MSLQPEKYLGKIVEVKFLDHVWGGNETELSLSRAWGKLIKDDWQKLVLQTYEADESETDNAEYAIIVRASVVSIRPLIFGD